MFNNREYINKLKNKIEDLELDKKCLKEDIESKENNILNLLEVNKELCLENQYFRDKVIKLKKVIKKHDDIQCELNIRLCRTKGQLEKIRNYYKMTTGTDILEGEEEWC